MYRACSTYSIQTMRTTLAIDDDVLAAAKALAQRESKTVGAVLTQLARQGLQRAAGCKSGAARNGIPLLARRKPRTAVTLELVNQLRNEVT